MLKLQQARVPQSRNRLLQRLHLSTGTAKRAVTRRECSFFGFAGHCDIRSIRTTAGGWTSTAAQDVLDYAAISGVATTASGSRGIANAQSTPCCRGDREYGPVTCRWLRDTRQPLSAARSLPAPYRVNPLARPSESTFENDTVIARVVEEHPRPRSHKFEDREARILRATSRLATSRSLGSLQTRKASLRRNPQLSDDPSENP